VAGSVAVATAVFLGYQGQDFGNLLNASSFAMSGGFGPVQVSTSLGMGALCSFLLLVVSPRKYFGVKVVSMALCLALLGQSMLTLSRSGLYCTALAVIAAIVYSIKNSHALVRVIVVVVLLAGFLYQFALPALDGITAGALSRRFANTSTTGRDQIILSDLRIWAKYPLLGVGPGQSSDLHSDRVFRHGISAHTEFTRLLAEHGILGLVSLLILLNMSRANLARAKTPVGKVCNASMVVWGLSYMLTAAFRTVAPALMLGISAATLTAHEPSDSETSPAV
jgi:hypothetical protein